MARRVIRRSPLKPKLEGKSLDYNRFNGI